MYLFSWSSSILNLQSICVSLCSAQHISHSKGSLRPFRLLRCSEDKAYFTFCPSVVKQPIEDPALKLAHHRFFVCCHSHNFAEAVCESIKGFILALFNHSRHGGDDRRWPWEWCSICTFSPSFVLSVFSGYYASEVSFLLTLHRGQAVHLSSFPSSVSRVQWEDAFAVFYLCVCVIHEECFKIFSLKHSE